MATSTDLLTKPGASLWRIVVVNDGPRDLGQIPMLEFWDTAGSPIYTNTATKSASSALAGHEAEFAFDSAGGTYWQASTKSKVGQYLELAFEKPVNISKLVYTSYQIGEHSVKDMATAFDLQYFDEFKSVWVTLYSVNQTYEWSLGDIKTSNFVTFRGLVAGQGDDPNASVVPDPGTDDPDGDEGEQPGTGGDGGTGGSGGDGTGGSPIPDISEVGTARLYLTPGGQGYGPIPGGDISETFGSNQAEKITMAKDARVVLDSSFGRGNDWIDILGVSGDYKIVATVVGITITSDNGANIRIPSFGEGGGLKLEFNDATYQLITRDGGGSFKLEGNGVTQTLGTVLTPIDPTAGDGAGSGSANYSLDVGSPGLAKSIDAALGNFLFVDNAAALSNVQILGFTNGDKITVTNADAGDYNFQRDFDDINDLVISYTDVATGATNSIVLDEVLPNVGPVNNLASATAAIGFDFMTFA